MAGRRNAVVLHVGEADGHVANGGGVLYGRLDLRRPHTHEDGIGHLSEYAQCEVGSRGVAADTYHSLHGQLATTGVARRGGIAHGTITLRAVVSGEPWQRHRLRVAA